MLHISWTERVTNIKIKMKPGIKLNTETIITMLWSYHQISSDFNVKYQKASLTVKRYRKNESHVD